MTIDELGKGEYLYNKNVKITTNNRNRDGMEMIIIVILMIGKKVK